MSRRTWRRSIEVTTVLVCMATGGLLAVASAQQPSLPRVEETPFGTKVTVNQEKGQDVIELPFGSVLRSAIWTAAQIPVCWENPQAAAAALRQSVRAAVTTTWQAKSRLRFIGWEQCSPQS